MIGFSDSCSTYPCYCTTICVDTNVYFNRPALFAGSFLCMNSPVDPTLLQLVQQEAKFLRDNVEKLSIEFDQEKVRVQQELENAAIILEELKQTVDRLKKFQGNLV